MVGILLNSKKVSRKNSASVPETVAIRLPFRSEISSIPLSLFATRELIFAVVIDPAGGRAPSLAVLALSHQPHPRYDEWSSAPLQCGLTPALTLIVVPVTYHTLEELSGSLQRVLARLQSFGKRPERDDRPDRKDHELAPAEPRPSAGRD